MAGNAAVARLAADSRRLARAPKVTPRRARRLIYLDGSVLDQVNRGNTAVADRLRELRKTATLRMTGYNHAEMTAKGDAVLRKANQLLVEDLGIGVDKQLTMAQRTKRGMEAWSGKPRVPNSPLIQPKDIPMAAGVPKGAELWSMDKTIRNQAASVADAFDIQIAPETTSFKPDAKAKPDYAAGRRLLQLDEVVIDPNGKLVRRGLQGRVVSGPFTTHVPSGEIVSGEIGGGAPPRGGAGGSPPPAKAPPAPRGGAGGSPPPATAPPAVPQAATTKAGGPIAKAEGKLVEAAAKAEGKLGSRLAKGAGRMGLSMLMPGPEDAIMLMVDFAGSYTEAHDTIRQNYTRQGVAMGIAAGMMGLDWAWVQENLWRRFATRDVATQVIAAVGLAERSYNDGLGRGHKYGAGHPQRMRSELLAEAFALLAQEGYATDEEGLFTLETVARVARVLMPIADDFLRQAAERREARQRREAEEARKEAKAWGAMGNKV
jgi:hypothetical protein